MENTTYITLSRQTALWRKMDVVANNIANMNTPGYKGEHMLFAEYLARSRSADSAFPDKLSYTTDFGTYRDASLGPMDNTGNPLDVAINGDGYFEVETDVGRYYTRNGRFMMDNDGMIVTTQGHPVLTTEGTPLFIAPNEKTISIARDGAVSTETGPVGRLRVVDFEDDQAMRRVQAGLYDAQDQEPQDVETVTLEQGTLEGANVQPVVEMTRLIEVHRAYETIQKLIETEGERQSRVMQTLSGVSQS
ncbi:flagellar basal-body rod protein FlgF [Roseospira visakhapatnamensis]|uniref:Flagellar basal-body rod protein FlgF n=1 Tax=Roseospira visakhapatnamensis TaxID=390880 RepID=A0A7W6RE13_9PROT|nr:flagellar basal-body rod protein FlgF [Roseospira visakhapatnamensis]MBB4266722.1 flagellar basal-body rod protein FlgF [Roseospira visakhapatnamensis]